MTVLHLIANLANSENRAIQDLYKGSNRINNIGDGLEEYIKAAIADTAELSPKEKLLAFEQTFSYEGSSARPPDLMLKGGDALEIKKTQSLYSELQLNSSHPKSKLHVDSPFLNKHCRECEDWQEKDLIYVVGHVDSKSKHLKSLWCVYGSLYAADESVYLDIKNQVSDALSSNQSLNFSETKELGRLNRVDPLKITNMRIRGMWLLQPPVKVFDYLYTYDDALSFQALVLIPEDKYLSFDTDIRAQMDLLAEKGLIQKESVQVKDPNNPVKLIKAIKITIQV